MHVDTLEPNRGRVQIEVDAPESCAEGIGQTRSALIVERISFPKNQWWHFAILSILDAIVFDDMGVYGLLSARMAHQSTLQGDSWRSGTTDVAETGISMKIVIGVRYLRTCG